MSAAHTLGPWSAEYTPTNEGVPFWGVYGADKRAIVYATLRSADELAANVRIIAAAPELLAMLEQVAEGHALHSDILDLIARATGAA